MKFRASLEVALQALARTGVMGGGNLSHMPVAKIEQMPRRRIAGFPLRKADIDVDGIVRHLHGLHHGDAGLLQRLARLRGLVNPGKDHRFRKLPEHGGNGFFLAARKIMRIENQHLESRRNENIMQGPQVIAEHAVGEGGDNNPDAPRV